MIKKFNLFNLAFALDENYLVPFYVLLTSVFKSNKKYIFTIHVITSGINEKDKSQLEAYVQENNCQIIFYNIDEAFIRNFAVSNETRYTISVYYRLFFPYLIPKSIKKILYLDIDTVVIGDLTELFKMDLGSQPIAAAPDANLLRPDLGIITEGEYFNSGVMLINLKAWKKLNITQKSIDFLIKYPEKAQYHDQDALNAVLIHNWYKLDNKYNLIYQILPNNWWNNQTYLNILTRKHRSSPIKKEFEIYLKDKIIVHYNHKVKPWLIGSYHPLRYLFNEYLLLFSKQNIGNSIISKYFSFEFIFLLMRAYENESNKLEARILIAFFLHLNWLKLSIKEIQDNSFNYLFAKYYSVAKLNQEELSSADFFTEFQNNKGMLLNIYRNIMHNKSSADIDNSSWLEKWKSLCKNEIVRLKLIDDKNNFTIISDLINLQLGITGSAKLLLHYFISNIVKDYGLTSTSIHSKI